jgi:hypothetical protein
MHLKSAVMNSNRCIVLAIEFLGRCFLAHRHYYALNIGRGHIGEVSDGHSKVHLHAILRDVY